MTDTLCTALLKAQTVMMGAKKDGTNPFFKSKYTTLNSVWEAAKDPLHENGLSLLQPIDIVGGQAVVKTIILHISGERIESNCPIVCAKQNDPQALGSAITYARRYSLASIMGIMTEQDDDAEKAMARNNNAPKPQQKSPQQTKPKEKEYPINVGKSGTFSYKKWLDIFINGAKGAGADVSINGVKNCIDVDKLLELNFAAINDVVQDYPEARAIIDSAINEKRNPSPAAKAV